jgi:MFS family permease
MEATKKSRIPVFLRKGRVGPFLTVVLSGQIIYSAFEAFKGSLMLPLQDMLGITGTQFGILMGYIGIATFLYVPAGWINNRFKVRTIIFWSLAWRLGTYLVLFVFTPSFAVMSAIAISWGVLDAIVWPAVVNGVSILSADQDKEGKGLAMGLLESIRRATEFLMNGVIVICMMVWVDQTVIIMRVFAIVYALLIIPMMIAVAKLVPDTKIAQEEGRSDNVAALTGLLRIIAKPRVWLAGLAALTVYWAYINLMYCSAPYLTEVFGVSEGMAGAFGIFNTGLVGVFAGVVSGVLADYVFKSSTKMMAVSLGLVTAACVVVMMLPVDKAMIWPILIMLIVVALATFLGKSVILAPIAELNLPEGVSGSAMSVGSFLAYASVFWAYTLNGSLTDRYAADPATGYRYIFMITASVALVGCIAATALVVVNHRANKKRTVVDA